MSSLCNVVSSIDMEISLVVDERWTAGFHFLQEAPVILISLD